MLGSIVTDKMYEAGVLGSKIFFEGHNPDHGDVNYIPSLCYLPAETDGGFCARIGLTPHDIGAIDVTDAIGLHNAEDDLFSIILHRTAQGNNTNYIISTPSSEYEVLLDQNGKVLASNLPGVSVDSYGPALQISVFRTGLDITYKINGIVVHTDDFRDYLYIKITKGIPGKNNAFTNIKTVGFMCDENNTAPCNGGVLEWDLNTANSSISVDNNTGVGSSVSGFGSVQSVKSFSPEAMGAICFKYQFKVPENSRANDEIGFSSNNILVAIGKCKNLHAPIVLNLGFRRVFNSSL